MELNKLIMKNISAPTETELARQKAEREAELAALEPIEYDELEKTVKEWMLVSDSGIIKLLPAIITANKIENHDPVWIFIIGPSGGGKTEFLNCLLDHPDIYPVSLLTPNTLLSGMPGNKDSSLLPQVTGKILIFKDWTNILSQNKDARNEIMGQLREVYDGHMKKPFGNGRIAEWSGKIGLIAGVTGAVDMAQQMHTTLGERFIHYRLAMPDRKEVARRALNNGYKQEDMRKALKNAFYSYMKGIEIPKELPDIPEAVKNELVLIANFCTMARSGVIREFGLKKEVMFVPAAEMPTRIVQQLTLLATALIINNKGKYEEDDMKIIYKVALDSIPQTNKMVMGEMARKDERTTAEIASSLGYPTGPIRMYLENLAMLSVCKRIKAAESEEGGNADRWTLYPEFVEILRRYEEIKLIEEAEAQKQEAIIDEALSFGPDDNAQGAEIGLGL